MSVQPKRKRAPRMSEHSQFLATLTELAKDPNVSADKLGHVVDAQERFAARNATQAFNVAFAAAQAAMAPIIKDAENSSTGSSYAKLETISEAIDPIIRAHGLSTSFKGADCPKANHYRVICTVRHDGGHAEDFPADVPADADAYADDQEKTAVHAFGSSMTYGRRYAKVLAFDVVLKDEDNDGNRVADVGDLISNEDLADLKREVEEVGASLDRLLRALRVESLAQLPASRLEEARRLIQARRGA